jgi:polar amino acid transport system permease protein
MPTPERPQRTPSQWVREGVEVPGSVAVLGLGVAAILACLVVPVIIVARRGFTPYERVVEAFGAPSMGLSLTLGLILGAVAILAGFGSFRRMPTKRSREQAIAGAVLGIQAVALALVFMVLRSGDPERLTFHFLNVEKLEGYGGAFVGGAVNTLKLAALGELGGIMLGIVLAVLVISKRRTVRAPAISYINFFRGTPLIFQLGFFFFVFRIAFGLRELSGFWIAVIVFALNTGAYASEVFRAGIQSIERGQMEAARSLGMSYFQAMRYAVIPQAFRRVIPPLMNEFVILIKDTALIIVIGLTEAEYEIFTVARTGYSDTFNGTFFIAAAVAYLAVTLPLIALVNAVERRLRSGLVSVA